VSPATEQVADPEVVKALGLATPNRPRRSLIWGSLALALLAALAFGITRFMEQRAAARAPAYERAKVTRQDIQVVITATGTLKGLNTVEVGAEVSGRVTKVHVDFNDPVTRGQVLAEIDPEQLQAAVAETAARLNEAEAAIRQARATAVEAEQNAARALEQATQGLISQKELEASTAARERAQASLASANASATVVRASLASAKSRLEKTRILSPIDGIVLSRLIEPGQTVTAGFQTPLLFKLAEDLRKMSLVVYIDEADIGRAHEGQAASFTVDAYPDRVFPSKLVSLRNEPKQDQNVVSYEAVLAVDNGELLLRPGMTATAEIVAEQRKNVLTVPNAALRFTPPDAKPGEASTRDDRRIWRLRDKKPESVSIKTGASDGQVTELLGGTLTEGAEVLTDVVEKKK
jgi:HlyD family secretion protein